MKARFDQETKQIFLRFPVSGNEVSFDRICGAIAWGDSTKDDPDHRFHALVIGGERSDGSVHQFKEYHYELIRELAAEAIRIKDKLYCEQLWVECEPDGHFRQLFDFDGLTKYESDGKTIDGLPKWKRPSSHWVSFRSREALATIQPYPKYFLEDFEAARSLVYDLHLEKNLVLSDTLMPLTSFAREQRSGDRPGYPIYRAHIGLLWSLWTTSKRRHGPPTPRPTRWPWDQLEGGDSDGLIIT